MRLRANASCIAAADQATDSSEAASLVRLDWLRLLGHCVVNQSVLFSWLFHHALVYTILVVDVGHLLGDVLFYFVMNFGFQTVYLRFHYCIFVNDYVCVIVIILVELHPYLKSLPAGKSISDCLANGHSSLFAIMFFIDSLAELEVQAELKSQYAGRNSHHNHCHEADTDIDLVVWPSDVVQAEAFLRGAVALHAAGHVTV